MAEGPRVVIIHPPQEVEADYIDYPYFSGLAAAGAAAALRKAGLEAHLLDSMALPGALNRPQRAAGWLLGRPHTALLEALTEARADAFVLHLTPFMVGRGCSHGLAALLRRLRELQPEALIVAAELYAGGMHRIEPRMEQLRLAYPELEALVTGEGEGSLPELLNGWLARRPEPGTVVAGRPATAAELAATLPPAWSEEQLANRREFWSGLADDPKTQRYRVDGATLPVYFSRGCPFDCAFCTNPTRDYRAVSPAKVEELMSWAMERGFGNLFVLDDAANVRPDFGELLEAAARRGLKLVWPNGLRADLLSRELVGLLARVSERLTVSAESAAPRVQRELLRKGVKLDHVEQVAGWCRQAGLPLAIHWLVAAPGEERAETQATLLAARRLLDEEGAEPLLQFVTPLPGTAVAEGGLGPADPARGAGPAGERMQHRPTFLPVGVAEEELRAAVTLLRRRAEAGRSAKVIINLTYRCNNHCLFCAVGNRIREDLPLARIREVLAEHAAAGVRLLDLDGGEPTLHPELFEVISLARELGYQTITVTTNGRRLAYEEFARRLLGSGISGLLISLHGADARLHEALTGVAGSYRETMAGLRNALALAPPGLDLGVNITLSRDNHPRLEELVEQLWKLGVRKVNLQFLTPFGRAAAQVAPAPEEAAAAVRETVARWRDRMTFQVVNLPFCYLPGLEEAVAQDLGKLSRQMVFVSGEEVNLHRYLAESRRLDGRCLECLLRVACDGRFDFEKVRD